MNPLLKPFDFRKLCLLSLTLSPSHPFCKEFVVDFIDSLLMCQQLFLNQQLRSFLNTAGGRKMVAFYKLHTSNLPRLSFVTNSNQKVALSKSQLKQCIFVSFLVLHDNLRYCLIDILTGNII